MPDVTTIGQLPRILPGQRFLIAGPTGCGKSVLARSILKSIPHVIVVDSKGDWDWDDAHPFYALRATTIPDLVKLLDFVAEQPPGGPYYAAPVVFSPTDLSPENLDRVAEIAFARGNTFVYYDELADLASASNYEVRAPHWKRVVQQGRSRKVGQGASTQRNHRVPLIAGTEADVRMTFFLRQPEDQKRMESFCGPVPWEQLARNKHSFVIATDEDLQSDVGLQPYRLNLAMQRSA